MYKRRTESSRGNISLSNYFVFSCECVPSGKILAFKSLGFPYFSKIKNDVLAQFMMQL